MAERSEGQLDQNELTHPSRRDVIRVLGGSALLGPFVWSGCFSRDPLSPDDDSGLQPRLDAQASLVNPGRPLILFVPGFTGGPGNRPKTVYYASQKDDLGPQDGRPGRDMFDMNDDPGFNSDRAAIGCNADAIADFLRAKAAKNDGQRVTIISHSKGGQDVMHALVKLNNEEDLPYRGGGDGPGRAVNRDLWHTVAGWVAFTTNWFESEFPIIGDMDRGCDFDNDTPAIGARLVPLPDCPDNSPSEYADFPNPGDRSRAQYMHDHERAITNLLACVPTVSAWGSYVPKVGNQGQLDEFNWGIRRNSKDDDGNIDRDRGANDGLVPARAGKLKGAMIKRLQPDAAKNKCGVDHLAPAYNVINPAHQFWTDDHRNQVTRNYLHDVESADRVCPTPSVIDVEIDIKPGSDPNSINCNNPNGVIPVAILSTDSFDATTVDHTTVSFEGASETHVDKRTGLPRRHEEDVNGDGLTDLVFHFRLGDADLACSSTEATLVGETFDGQPIIGVDSVRMIDAGNGNRGDGGNAGGNGHGKGGNPEKGNNGNKGGNGNGDDKGNKGGNGKGKGKGQDQ